jgi:hypothetical protein
VCLHGVRCAHLYGGVCVCVEHIRSVVCTHGTSMECCVQLCSVWRVVYTATVHVCMSCMLLVHVHAFEVCGVCTQLLGVWSVHIYSAYVCKVCIRAVCVCVRVV